MFYQATIYINVQHYCQRYNPLLLLANFMTIIIVSYYKLNLSSASPLTTSSPGLLYTLKPTKFGFHVTAEGFPEKMSVLVARIAEAVYSCALGPATLAAVLEVHRRGLQSCAAEPLRSQSRYSWPLLSGDPTCIPVSLPGTCSTRCSARAPGPATRGWPRLTTSPPRTWFSSPTASSTITPWSASTTAA